MSQPQQTNSAPIINPALAQRIQAQKAISPLDPQEKKSDGISTDSDGNVYINGRKMTKQELELYRTLHSTVGKPIRTY